MIKPKRDYDCWHSYHNMLQRCYNPNNPCYHHYGGRGIVVCDSWRNDFWTFLKDMGEKPDGLTIERIDNNKGYSSENCKWASRAEQSKNTRNTVYVMYMGEKHKLIELAEKLGLNYITLYNRIFTYKFPEHEWGKPINSPSTYCRKGLHLMTDAYVHPKTGLRVCRKCKANRERKYYKASKLKPLR